MANFSGAYVCDAVEIETYQPDVFGFGIASTDTEATNFFSQTTNDILRELRIRWWPVYKTNVYTDITVLNTAEMVDTKVNLDQFKRAFPVQVAKHIYNFNICGTWGDPLTNNDLLDIAKYIRQVNPEAHISINTNGSLRNFVITIFLIDGTWSTFHV